MKDMARKGRASRSYAGAVHWTYLQPHRRKRGASNGRAVLREVDVQSIRASYRKGDGVTLARKYGVCKSTILRIVWGKLWAHV
jgi:hypothetical protein